MNTFPISIYCPKGSAGANAQNVWSNPLDVDVVVQTSYAPRFAPDTTVATDGTNYATITLASSVDGGTTWVDLYSCTTNATGGAALAVDVATTMTINAAATGASFRLARGGLLRVKKTYAGSGAAVGGSVVLSAVKVP